LTLAVSSSLNCFSNAARSRQKATNPKLIIEKSVTATSATIILPCKLLLNNMIFTHDGTKQYAAASATLSNAIKRGKRTGICADNTHADAIYTDGG
jgi:hypothetical protein